MVFLLVLRVSLNNEVRLMFCIIVTIIFVFLRVIADTLVSLSKVM